MAQPHIIDHTRLHMDLVADTPIVAPHQAPVSVSSVGVQCSGVDAGLNYDENVVTVRFLLFLPVCCATMGWLRLVGSFERQVCFVEYRLFYRALLQKRPIILRSLLIKATPYAQAVVAVISHHRLPV